MNSDDDLTGPVNLGNPTESTILELAQATIDLVGSRSELTRKPLPFDDPKRRCPDITLAKEKLDWQPMVTLRVGLEKTIEYFDTLLSKKQTFDPLYSFQINGTNPTLTPKNNTNNGNPTFIKSAKRILF